MQREYTQKWTEFCQSLNKPMAQITDLNLKTFNRLTKDSGYLDELLKARKPEDLMSAQMRLANAAGIEAVKYWQEAYNIITEATSQNTEIFKDVVHKAGKYEKSGEL